MTSLELLPAASSSTSGASTSSRVPHSLPPVLERLTIRACDRLTLGEHPEYSRLSSLKKFEWRFMEPANRLPECTALLTGLEHLVLHSNADFTNLPHGITGLINLKELVLGGDLCRATSPKNVVSGMSRLTSLIQLSMSQYSGKTIPDDMFRGLKKSLQKVLLTHCGKLTSLPSSLGELPNLEYLAIPDSPLLTSLPDPLMTYSSLTYLDAGEASRKLVLASAVHMSNIQTLVLNSANSLEKFPSLSRLTRLSDLKVDGVFRFRTIPHPLPISLRTLAVQSGKFLSLPSHFSTLTNLSTLALSFNDEMIHLFSEDDSVSPSSSSSSQRASTSQLQLETRYLAALAPSLRSFRIQGPSKFTSIPASISVLTGLQSFGFEWQRFPWTIIPDCLSTLTALTSLKCGHCTFSKLPAGLSTLTSLRELDLSGNLFEDLPSCIFNLHALETLNLEDNEVVMLPDDFSNLTNLVTLRESGVDHFDEPPPLEVVPADISMLKPSVQREIREIIQLVKLRKKRDQRIMSE